MLRLRFSKSSMRFCERSMRVVVKELWELLREKYERVFREKHVRERRWFTLWVVQITCEGEKMFAILIDPRRTDLTTQPAHWWGKWPGTEWCEVTTFKIESLRLGFQKRKPSLKDSILANVEHTWKSSLKDSISTCASQVASSHLRTHKPSLKGSIYGAKTEPLRLEMLSTYFLPKAAY